MDKMDKILDKVKKKHVVLTVAVLSAVVLVVGGFNLPEVVEFLSGGSPMEGVIETVTNEVPEVTG